MVRVQTEWIQKQVKRWSVAHLVLGDLHVQDDVVNELRQGFLHRRLELVVLQQRVDKLKDTEHQILKPQNFTCKH